MLSSVLTGREAITPQQMLKTARVATINTSCTSILYSWGLPVYTPPCPELVLVSNYHSSKASFNYFFSLSNVPLFELAFLELFRWPCRMQIRFYNRPFVPSPLDLFCNAVFKAWKKWKNIQLNWSKPKIKVRLYSWILCCDQEKGWKRSTKSCTSDRRNAEVDESFVTQTRTGDMKVTGSRH